MIRNKIYELYGVEQEIRDYIENSEFKRLGLLSVLCDNNAQFVEILESINLSDKNNILEVFELFNNHFQLQYPLDVISEFVDNIQSMCQEVFVDVNSKILDPNGGYGLMLVFVYSKMFQEHSRVNPDVDPNEIRRNILENCLYYVGENIKEVFLYQLIFDPYEEFKLNIFYGNYLSDEFSEYLESNNLDFFDLIISNPPYTSEKTYNNRSIDLYPKYIARSIDISCYISMMMPSKWFINRNSLEFRERMLNNYGLRFMKNFLNPLLFKGTDLRGGYVQVILENGYNDKIVLFNSVETDLTKYDVIPTDNSDILNGILEKVTKYDSIEDMYNCKFYFKITSNDKRLVKEHINGYVPCYVSKYRGYVNYIDPRTFDREYDYFPKWKVMIPSSSKLGGMGENFYNRMIIAEPFEVCNQAMIFFAFDTQQQAKSFESYMKTDLVSYLIRLRKMKHDLNKSTFRWTPIVPFNIIWNNDMVYDFFNLSTEERMYITNILYNEKRED